MDGFGARWQERAGLQDGSLGSRVGLSDVDCNGTGDTKRKNGREPVIQHYGDSLTQYLLPIRHVVIAGPVEQTQTVLTAVLQTRISDQLAFSGDQQRITNMRF